METLVTWVLLNLDKLLAVGAAIAALAVWLLQVGVQRGWLAMDDEKEVAPRHRGARKSGEQQEGANDDEQS
jgi:uncharacterized membrane protein